MKKDHIFQCHSPSCGIWLEFPLVHEYWQNIWHIGDKNIAEWNVPFHNAIWIFWNGAICVCIEGNIIDMRLFTYYEPC